MSEKLPQMEGPVCPLPKQHSAKIVLGHGSGGKMMTDLIQGVFQPPLENPALDAGNDAGVVELPSGQKLAVSTDAHVVSPLFFPGGDIGRLAVCGTVNDVAMVGARPRYLSASFILEEGLEVEVIRRVVESMREAAREAGVEVIAGDTKVVARGEADRMYISTTGVGTFDRDLQIGGAYAQPGDLVLVSGTLGDHGIAVLEARGELGFETELTSDVAPLNGMIAEMLEVSRRIHVLRDPTRGGAASALNEIACQSEAAVVLEEDRIPVRPPVKAACELLGFDPLYVANEGKALVIVHPDDAGAVLEVMRDHRCGRDAALIGRVEAAPRGRLLMETGLGSTRVVDVLAGEMLPRIC
jgi:hydrogenase expression/formation protein HypE